MDTFSANEKDTQSEQEQTTKAAAENGNVFPETNHEDKKEGIYKSPPSERFGNQPQTKRPTYIKIHREHIDPETLDIYGLSWEWYSDREFVLIKQWVPDELQEELFAHTRRRRNELKATDIAGQIYRGKQCMVRDKHGETAILTVDLSESKNQTISPFGQIVSRKPTADRLEERYGFEAITRISISSAYRFRDPSGRESAVLKYQTAAETPTEISSRWTHLQWKARSLSEFERFALKLRGVDVDDRLIITRLMQTVQAKYERVSVSGLTLQPIAVRCDGRNSTDQKKAERWALFLCFPYLSLQSPATPQDIRKQPFHFSKTLLEARYPLETIQDRDHEQIVGQIGHLTKDQILHIPSLWALILSSGVLLSSSPESFEAIIGENLKLERLSTNSPERERAGIVIRAVDPDLKVFNFPLAECKTWFALMDRILSVCHNRFGDQPRNYCITQPDGTLINAETWQRYSTAHIPVVNIVIRRLSNSPPKVPEHDKRIENVGQSKTRTNPAQWVTSYSGSNIDSVFQDASVGAPYKPHLEESNVGEVSPEAAKQSSVPGQGVLQISSATSTSNNGASSPVHEITRQKTPPVTQALIVRSTNPLEERVRASELEEKIPVRVTDDKRLVTIRPRPPQYSPSPNNLPPNRVPRYMMPLPEDLVTNVPFVNVSQEVYKDIYFQVRGHQISKSTQVVRTNLENKNEGDSSSVNNMYTESCRSDKDHGTGKEPGPTPAHPSAMLNRVPPVFLWPAHAPLRHSPTHEAPSNQDNVQTSGRQDMKNKKGSQDDADSKLSRNSTNSSDESLIAILNHIHSPMSSDEDYAILLMAGKKPTSGKFYRSLPEVSRSDVQDQIDEAFSYPDPQPSDLVADYLVSWNTRILELYLDLESLFAFFVPVQQAGTALHKYWGAVGILVQLLAMMSKPHFLQLKAKETLDLSYHSFHVVDLEQTVDRRKELSWFTPPNESFQSCPRCLDRQQYSSVSEAIEHLRLVHFSSLSVTDEFLGLWIVFDDHLWDYQIFSDGHTLLLSLSTHIDACLELANEIKAGVSGVDGFDQDLYRVPASLVKAFQGLLMLIAYVGQVCAVIRRIRKDQFGYRPLTLINDEQTGNISILGFNAEGMFELGRNDLMLMSCAGEYSRAISYESVGTEYITGLLIDSLAARTNGPDALNLGTLYRKFATHLGYKASRRPRRRLLSKMLRTLEEVEYVRDVIEQQEDLMRLYDDLLDPRTFHITTKSREILSDLEDALLYRSASERTNEARGYDNLITDVRIVVARTKSLVEIEQDDHGKAILVFTIVTITFLPLSFVTSFLGMNTHDIRNQTNSQWIFWATALPLTSVVVLVSIYIGYRIDDLHDSWERLFARKKQLKALEPRNTDYR